VTSYQTESKPQCWRAVVVFDDRAEMLLYLNRSTVAVRAGYRSAYLDLLDAEERQHVVNVSMQRWQGASDSGRWVHQSDLPVPLKERIAIAV